MTTEDLHHALDAGGNGRPEACDVSVIIVNYNVREFLLQAIESVVRATDGFSVEIIVVDNNSVDGSVEALRRCYPRLRIIENRENIGFGAANNQAIRESTGRFLLILNPDTIVQEDTLAELVAFMNTHPDAGAVGCRILNPDGTFARESRRAFPTPSVAFYRISGLSRLFPRSPRFGRYNLTHLPQDEVAEVDALSGSCMMLRRDALCHSRPDSSERPQALIPRPPTRLFDEDFFMYGEDLDLCYRIQEDGWKIYYTPATRIIHYKGESTRKGDLRYVRLFYGAMLLFAEKHFGRRSFVLQAGLRLAILVRAAISVMTRTLRRVAPPALDFFIVYASVVVVAVLWPGTSGIALTPRFLMTTPLAYAIATVVQIRLSRGYARHNRSLRPAVVGILVAFAFMAALSFFVKSIAFSRVVIVATLLPAGLLLVAWRMRRKRRRTSLRRALVVGERVEAVGLDQTVSSHFRPPFVVAGYVNDEEPDNSASGSMPRLGTAAQLRDIVRIHQIDELIFATNRLSNRTVLSLMQSLRDLPVEFKTLVADGTQVIGKTRVDDLSIPIVPADVGRPGQPGPIRWIAHRAIAAAGVLIWPAIWLLSVAVRGRRFALLQDKLRRMPRVLAGRLALIGFLPEDSFLPPDEWQLREGVFSASEMLTILRPGASDVERAWLFYLHNQSISLDIRLIFQSLRGLPAGRPE